MSLAAIEGALIELSGTAYAAAHALRTAGEQRRRHRGPLRASRGHLALAAGRHRPVLRAAGPRPASLQEAGGALRMAAARCGRAADNLAATMEPVKKRPERRPEAA